MERNVYSMSFTYHKAKIPRQSEKKNVLGQQSFEYVSHIIQLWNLYTRQIWNLYISQIWNVELAGIVGEKESEKYVPGAVGTCHTIRFLHLIISRGRSLLTGVDQS